MSVTVLKLGGSVVTEKDRPETLDEPALERAAAAVAAALEGGLERLVLVHGGGSFGHHHANEHGVTTVAGTTDPQAIDDIRAAMATLNDHVLGRLLERGVPAIPVHPLSAAYRDAAGTLTLSTGPVETMLDEGFVPVLHGDVLVHAGEGATVVSGDELVADLARSLEAERIGLCSSVPGVLDREGRVVERIESYDDVASILGESEATDVTGGMAAKVRELLELEASASIFGLEGLETFLAGEPAGTTLERR